jgi:hypothetical protein
METGAPSGAPDLPMKDRDPWAVWVANALQTAPTWDQKKWDRIGKVVGVEFPS